MSSRPPIVSLAALLVCLWALGHPAGAGVRGTKHNLSISGPGPVKVPGETEICKFCHTPHASNPIAPLWNRADPGTFYETYKSPTLKAVVGQPTGSSRLCLSCHDGTIALTETYNRARPIAGTIFISEADRGHIGTRLSDDHPISFIYDVALAAAKGQLRSPSSLSATLPLDVDGRLQCTTCHDPHDNSRGNFLRVSNVASAMCVTCHDLTGWAVSSHGTATASVAGATRDRWDNVPYSNMRDLACQSCHRPHNAGGRARLVRHEAEEDNCLNCHDGSVASTNIAAEFSKTSVHPVTRTAGVHFSTEDPRSMTEHVECGDCHNPHQATGAGAPKAPAIRGALKGASGMSGLGVPIPVVANEYEVCYKCHAKSDPVRRPIIDRIVRENNIARKFAVDSLSFHPVQAVGQNRDVPSLVQPMDVQTLIYCTSCHSSDGGNTRGPHGSAYRPLLVGNYSFTEPTNTDESPQAYALCYGCHNRDSILADQGFPEHKEHLKEKVTCSVCHDPHGVKDATHLINFDRNYVFPSKKAGTGPTFVDTGTRRGSCTLLCHGEDHDPETYGGKH